MLVALSQISKIACAAIIAYGLILLTFSVVERIVLPVLMAMTGGVARKDGFPL